MKPEVLYESASSLIIFHISIFSTMSKATFHSDHQARQLLLILLLIGFTHCVVFVIFSSSLSIKLSYTWLTFLTVDECKLLSTSFFYSLYLFWNEKRHTHKLYILKKRRIENFILQDNFIALTVNEILKIILLSNTYLTFSMSLFIYISVPK